jgi:preprotein translocase subunit SecE
MVSIILPVALFILGVVAFIGIFAYLADQSAERGDR